MKWSSNIKLSYKALLLNKSRLVFSVLSVAIGIAAVIVTVSIGAGAREKAIAPIRSMGNNLIVVNPVKTKKIFRDRQTATAVTTFRMTDIESLSELDHLKYISAFQQLNGTIKYEGQTIKALIQGVSVDYLVMRNYKFTSGFNFNSADNHKMEKVVVLGATSSAQLFNGEDPLDKTVFINNIRFRVIGVLQIKGLEAEMGNIDNVAIVPIKTFLRRVSNLDYLGQIYLSADEQKNCETLEAETKNVLRQNHKLDILDKDDDFVIVNQLSSIKAAEETSKGFNLLIIGVAAISLVIGGVGILALMILSLKERIGEIGLRRSVGARKINIVFQFLSESLLLGIAGGISGMVLGLAASFLTNALSSWNTVISWPGIVIPFLMSAFTALIFGAVPAYRAANLDPVEALRNE